MNQKTTQAHLVCFLAASGLRVLISPAIIHLMLVHQLCAPTAAQLTVFGATRPQLICSHKPIIALAGDDVILPCHLEPEVDADYWTVVWTKPGLEPKYVHNHQAGRLLFEDQNPSYYYRTRLFVDELIRGNVSMKIFKVKMSDKGKYVCFIPTIQKEASIQLIVGSVSTPFIKVYSNNNTKVVLKCKSKGWYPEPEVLWLDGEGNVLSAGPTETVRGPDDLYTVSSRVTVAKRHGNTFTCRVQQNNINQTRETHIHVPAAFYMVRSSLWQEILTLGCSCILLLLLMMIIIYSQRNNRSSMCSAVSSRHRRNPP